MGARPAKASWYALTWYTLDLHPRFDPGTLAGFKRWAYRVAKPLPDKAAPLLPMRKRSIAQRLVFLSGCDFDN